ncbi:MAG TPA: Smr/MutS family protein, partial [Candidatus Binataceae bacterium]|nr:Smr/MutS family protein [Candidatus Binataceae bacterium]
HTMGQSYGLAVAQRLGLPEEIIREARAAMPAGSADLERVLTLLERERAQLHVETERLRTLAREAADRDAVATANAERAAARTRADRDRFLLESREMLSATRRDAAAILDDLRVGRKSRRDVDTMLADASATLARVAPDAAEAVNDDTPLKPGDQVEFGDIRGELVALEAGRAIVTRGGLRIEVSPERLRRSRAAAPSPAPRPQPPAITVNVAAEPGAELNLIGMRSADALRRLEEFLDQAYLTNRRDIRVVHGIGSGALRKAIHEYLTTSPYCAEFHQADPQHGGAGATIIQLNL